MRDALPKMDRKPRSTGRTETRARRVVQERTLAALRNVGPRFLADLDLLGITSVAMLARRDPVRLYRTLEKKTGSRQDPCVLDTFMAIVHEARTGEPLDWWKFTAARKAASPESSSRVRPRK